MNTAKPKDWWTNPHNVHTLALYMIEDCANMDEVRMVISQVLSKPWNWRVEFIVATCRQRDARAA